MYGRWILILGQVQQMAHGWGAQDFWLASIILVGFLGLLLGVMRRHDPSVAKGDGGPAIKNPVEDLAALACRISKSTGSAKITFGPGRVVEEASRQFAGLAQSKRVRFKTVLAANLPRQVRGHPSHIATVLTSLLENAVKFTDEGVVRVEAALRRERRRAWVQFRVYDTGIGMDSETLARVLEGNGAGHGILASRRLVAEMGGTMGAESEPRGGSTFWFSVPVEVVEEARITRPRPTAEPERAPAWVPVLPRAPQPGKRILIVESDGAEQVAILWGVRTLGYAAEVVITSQGAIEMWGRGPFDLILLGGRIGEANEVAARIRRLETGCVPIVGLGRAVQKTDASIDGFIAKPVCLLELARTLDHWLGACGPGYVSEANSDKLSLPV